MAKATQVSMMDTPEDRTGLDLVGRSGVPALPSMPAEILLMIFETLQYDTESLQNLCLVNRSFKRAAQEVIVRHITLAVEQPHSLARFVKMLLDKRHLRIKVQTLNVCLSVYWSDSTTEEEPSVPPIAWGQIAPNISVTQEEACSTDEHTKRGIIAGWNKHINEQREPALFGFLLTLLPDLRCLTITVWSGGRYIFSTRSPLHFMLGLKRPDPRDNTLSGDISRDLNFLSDTFVGTKTIRSLKTTGRNLAILNLPFDNLRDLTLRLPEVFDPSSPATDDRDNLFETETLHRSYSRLEALTIESNSKELRLPTIQTLIERLGCVKLKKFRFVITWTNWSHHWNNSFENLKEPLLYTWIDSLEHLIIDHDYEYDEKYDFGDSLQYELNKWFRPFHSLREFHRLTHLEIFPRVILPRGPRSMIPISQRNANTTLADILPPSLESISFITPNGKLIHWLAALFQVRADFPRLREIRLISRREDGGTLDWFRKPFAVFADFQRSGVVVSLIDETDRPRKERFEKEIPHDFGGLDIWDDAIRSPEDWLTPLLGDAAY